MFVNCQFRSQCQGPVRGQTAGVNLIGQCHSYGSVPLLCRHLLLLLVRFDATHLPDADGIDLSGVVNTLFSGHIAVVSYKHTSVKHTHTQA